MGLLETSVVEYAIVSVIVGTALLFLRTKFFAKPKKVCGKEDGSCGCG